MISKISQTFIKMMRAYMAAQECGHIIRETFVNDRFFDNEEPGAMELGTYFEYKLSGAIPKNKVIPKAILMKSGEPNAQYRMADFNAGYIRKLLDDYGLNIIQFGHRLTKGKLNGIIDLIVEATRTVEHSGFTWNVGDKFVIDLKYSGLIDDKWNQHGWMWTPIQKKYHGTQAIQYHYISGMPFYFLVTGPKGNEADNTKDGPNIKFFRVEVSEFDIEQHIIEGNDLFEKFMFYKDIGFTAYPSYNKCHKCPLKEECAERQTLPSVETVDLNVD